MQCGKYALFSHTLTYVIDNGYQHMYILARKMELGSSGKRLMFYLAGVL